MLLWTACDPHASMSGTVKHIDESPVSGATVSITCDSLDEGSMKATTDAEGTFSASKIGCIDKKCTIDVADSGEPIRRFPTADYCVAKCNDSCPSAIEAALRIPAVPWRLFELHGHLLAMLLPLWALAIFCFTRLSAASAEALSDSDVQRAEAGWVAVREGARRARRPRAARAAGALSHGWLVQFSS
jgi:hypothetical protein